MLESINATVSSRLIKSRGRKWGRILIVSTFLGIAYGKDIITIDAVPHPHQKIGEDIWCRRVSLLDLRQKCQPGVQVLLIQTVCRLPHLQLETPPDKNNRPQRKSTSTQKVKSEYYSNAYACNSCSKSKTVDDDGIWHCNACNYDLCPDCA